MREAIVTEILNNEVCLDTKCWVCAGGTKEPESNWQDKHGVCECCHGIGFELTDFGEAIIKLVQRHEGRKL
jgi:hypothetical protein